MDWKLSQDTASKDKKSSFQPSEFNREKQIASFGHSERNVPHPVIAPTTTEELLKHHEEDLNRSRARTAQFVTNKSNAKNQVFVKLVCKHHGGGLNLDYFKQAVHTSDPNTGEVITTLGEVPEGLDAHFQTVLKQYYRKYPLAIYENIWFSQETQKLFSNAQTYCSGLDPIEHSFCSTPINFVNQTWTAIGSEMGRMIEDLTVGYNALGQRPNAYGVNAQDISSGRCYGDIVHKEYRIGLCPAVNALCNQDSVLIVGGGPSTNKIDFSKFRDVPVWTMNNYYKNPVFDQFNNIQVACFLDEVDVFNNNRLWEYVNDRETMIFQEITDYGPTRIKYIKDSAKYSTYFHTRYRSKLGVGPRLLVTAILLGIKNIYFCGFDGYSMSEQDQGNNHSFESGKNIPNWMKNSPNGHAVQREQYVMLWDYILNNLKLYRPCKITDLSANQPTLQYEFLQDKIR